MIRDIVKEKQSMARGILENKLYTEDNGMYQRAFNALEKKLSLDELDAVYLIIKNR